jgi:3-isopropylmalate/(R)-2-methylmalate dehydratase small subunit
MTPSRMTSLRSRVFILEAENIDTDQVIPARFLKTTESRGLGRYLFADWNPRPDPAGAAVLIAGRNFGCGSSREHAAWALIDAGFRAVVSTQLADIFRQNAVKNGLLPITIEVDVYDQLLRERGEVSIDLAEQRITLSDGTSAIFPIEPFAKHCLLKGIDQLDFLLAERDAIAAYEATHATHVVTRS